MSSHMHAFFHQIRAVEAAQRAVNDAQNTPFTPSSSSPTSFSSTATTTLGASPRPDSPTLPSLASSTPTPAPNPSFSNRQPHEPHDTLPRSDAQLITSIQNYTCFILRSIMRRAAAEASLGPNTSVTQGQFPCSIASLTTADADDIWRGIGRGVIRRVIAAAAPGAPVPPGLARSAAAAEEVIDAVVREVLDGERAGTMRVLPCPRRWGPMRRRSNAEARASNTRSSTPDTPSQSTDRSAPCQVFVRTSPNHYAVQIHRLYDGSLSMEQCLALATEAHALKTGAVIERLNGCARRDARGLRRWLCFGGK